MKGLGIAELEGWVGYGDERGVNGGGKGEGVK